MNITKNLTLKDAMRSSTAIRMGIDNTPDEGQVKNLRRWSEKIWEPVCRWSMDKYGKLPFKASVFRCAALNEAIGGSKTSDHCKGNAGDIDGDSVGIPNSEIFDFIRENCEYDQLIYEFPDKNGNAAWVHASHRESGNRKMRLKAVKENGRTNYINI